ncbi:hypothetical protein HF086_001115 [Spodoptera exigua]|uniref:Glutamate--tRNA ligase, mitochondrial n=1 Tax=Spodoptera exigua TaxID=7107 RepID=A0A922S928_SPOEX|nr:hypothetical protein HF086_001115 [Spodoptera exigua]
MCSILAKRFIFTPNRNLFKCISTKSPRVRFAPSPTGYLHLGGLRTALYNYLFAKSRSGTFVLRIEDTDQTRKVEGSVEALVNDLHWAGIECNEGPGINGKYGPYVQSERLNIYQEHIQKLLDNGSAYKCFCTERRLNILRRDAVKSQRIPKYDNRCRSLSPEEIKQKMDAGVPHCIRFKLTSDCQYFEDLIFGSIAYDVSLNEGDPVLMKSDGFPTYHFANVVDDHLMAITHVLREIKRRLKDEDQAKSLVSKLQELITKTYPEHNLNLTEEHVKTVLKWSASRISKIEELTSKKYGFLWILPKNTAKVDQELLRKLVENLEGLDKFDQGTLKESLRSFSAKNDVKFPALMKMLRSVISGLDEGPGVAEMMDLLGKSQSLERIKAVVRYAVVLFY